MPVKAKYLSRSRENFQFKTDLGLKNIGGLAELRCSAILLVLVSKFRTCPVKTKYCSLSQHNFPNQDKSWPSLK